MEIPSRKLLSLLTTPIIASILLYSHHHTVRQPCRSLLATFSVSTAHNIISILEHANDLSAQKSNRFLIEILSAPTSITIASIVKRFHHHSIQQSRKSSAETPLSSNISHNSIDDEAFSSSLDSTIVRTPFWDHRSLSASQMKASMPE